MALHEKNDYVLAPKGTYIQNGINTVCIIGTKKHLFLVPIKNISGAGNSIETTTFGIGKSLHGILQAAANVSELEQELMLALNSMPGFHFRLDELAEFNVKSSFFSRGIYIKKPGDRGFTGIAISGKEFATNFEHFYQ